MTVSNHHRSHYGLRLQKSSYFLIPKSYVLFVVKLFSEKYCTLPWCADSQLKVMTQSFIQEQWQNRIQYQELQVPNRHNSWTRYHRLIGNNKRHINLGQYNSWGLQACLHCLNLVTTCKYKQSMMVTKHLHQSEPSTELKNMEWNELVNP